MPLPRIVSFLCLSSFGVAVAAQHLPPGIDLTAVAGLSRDGQGAATAIGAAYRATFANGGVTFVPALGDAAPARQPWTFRLLSVAHGGTPLPLAADAEVAIVHERRAEYARGAVVERYDARPDGLELSFVLAERPAGDGDLIVRGAVTSPAAPAPTAAGGLRFVDERWGGVELGAVTGVAADGARCRGSMAFAGGVLELRLPGAFVTQAAYPLVLDPLIGAAFAVGAPGIVDFNVDVAYESGSGNYLAVWERGVAGSAREIYGQRITSAGALNGAPFAIAGGIFADTTNPTVCASVPAGRFLVAWQEATMFTTTVEVRGCTVAAATGATTAASTWSVGATRTFPALCAGADSGSLNTMLAWRAPGVGVEIRRVSVTAAGVVSFGTTATAIATTATIDSGPNLTPTRNAGNVGIVAVETMSSGNHTLTLRAFGTSAPAGSQVAVVLAFAGVVRNAVASDGAAFSLVYSQGDVRHRAVTWNGSALVLGAVQVLQSGFAVRAFELAWLGDRYLLAWEEDLGILHGAVRGVTVKPDGTLCSPVITPPVVSASEQMAPALASVREGGGADDTGLWLWTERIPTSIGNLLSGQRFEAMVGSAPVQLSPGCMGGGVMTGNGPFALGNQTFRFELANGDPTAPFAVLGLSDGSTMPATCGCTFTQSLVTMVALAQAGSASLPFAVPCDPSLLGFQLEAQWFLVGGTASPCPFLPGFTGSNRLRFTVAQ